MSILVLVVQVTRRRRTCTIGPSSFFCPTNISKKIAIFEKIFHDNIEYGDSLARYFAAHVRYYGFGVSVKSNLRACNIEVTNTPYSILLTLNSMLRQLANP
jgi:hypothetical protein